MFDKMRIMPEVSPFLDDEHNTLDLFISMPGVKKEDISVEIDGRSLLVSAPTEDIEYITAMMFDRLVHDEKVETKYECDLFRVKVPFKNESEKEDSKGSRKRFTTTPLRTFPWLTDTSLS